MEPITLGYSRPKTPPQAENLLQASNTNIVATLGEVIHLGRVNETAVYDHLECCFYEPEGVKPCAAGELIITGTFEARLALVETSDVTIEGRFANANGEPLGGNFSKTYSRVSGVAEHGSFRLDRPARKEDVFLTVTASYTARGALQTVAETVRFAENDDKFTVSLTHPAKRQSHAVELEAERIYGNPEAEPDLAGNFQDDPGHILVALLRKPHDMKDIDYLCGFGRTVDNKPYLGLPGKAKLDCKDGGRFTECVSAYCYLYEINNNGGAMVQAAFGTDSGDSKIINVTGQGPSVAYSMPRDKSLTEGAWSNRGEPAIYRRNGGWEQTAYHYEMRVTLRFALVGDSAQYKTYEVILTSRKGARFSRRAGVDSITVFDGLLPLKIMFGCLAEGTQVLTASGANVPIERIQIGDLLATPTGTARVTNTWRGYDSEMIKIGYDNGSVLLTAAHPVMTPSGYVKARQLAVGDDICLHGSSAQTARITELSPQTGDFNVCNLDTEDNKPFVAGGILVGTNQTQNTI